MNNDYLLLADSADDGTPVDPDIALITAYLCDELNASKTSAVERRVAANHELALVMQDIRAAWAAPLPRWESSAAMRKPGVTPPSDDERAEGWNRFVQIEQTTGKSGRRNVTGTPTVLRRSTLARIAALIVIVLLPVFAVAQLVMYMGGQRETAPHFTLASAENELAEFRWIVDYPVQQSLPLIQLPAPQAVPVVDLPVMNLRTKLTFGAILGVRQTSDGRVLVNDPVRYQLHRLEPDMVTSSVILDSVPGRSNSYRDGGPNTNWSTRVLSSFLGDSSVFGPVGANVVVLDGQGRVVRAIAMGLGGPMLLNGPHYWDPLGRFVFVGPSKARTYNTKIPGRISSFATMPVRPDTVPVVRLTGASQPRSPGGRLVPASYTYDTLGLINRPENQPPRESGGTDGGVQNVGNGGGRLLPVPRSNGGICWPDQANPFAQASTCFNDTKQVINPLYAVDDWALLSDGTLALIRGLDYSIDWIQADGAKHSSGKLAFEWKRASDEDKQKILDSTRASIDSLDKLAEILEARDKPRQDSVRNAARVAGLRGPAFRDLTRDGPPVRVWPYEIVPLSEMADYYPPIRPNAAKPDADGNLWILPRMTSQSKQGELVYDVVNPTRGLVQRVRLPLGRSIAGFGKGGVVYLQHGDLKGGFFLERSTLPSPIPK